MQSQSFVAEWTFNSEMKQIKDEATVIDNIYLSDQFNQFTNQSSTLEIEHNRFNEKGCKKFLEEKKWPLGLQHSFIQNARKIRLKYFLCDDSSSMNTNEGHMLETDINGAKRTTNFSRWKELVNTVNFHAELASASQIPTEFRFLNRGQPIMIGAGDSDDSVKLELLKIEMLPPAKGKTPLCKRFGRIVKQITPHYETLRNLGCKVSITIITDGQATDGDIKEAMKALKGQPVWISIILSTDDQSVIKYWNDVDRFIEENIDVMDDYFGESDEVFEKNSWLTYGEPIHRMRENGNIKKEFDLLDEKSFSKDHILTFCSIIFDRPKDDFPHPQIDWPKFIDFIRVENALMDQVWSAKTCQMEPWINVDELDNTYNPDPLRNPLRYICNIL